MSRRTRRRRDTVAKTAVVVGTLVACFAIFQLVRGDDEPPRRDDTAATPFDNTPDDSVPYDLGPSDDAEPPDLDPTGIFGSGTSSFFTTTTGPRASHTFTLRVTTDSLSQWAYKWRDRPLSETHIMRSGSDTVTRTYTTSLPGGVIAIQLSPSGGRATCSVTVDGAQSSSDTAEGPRDIAICGG